jgi:hypothetical protein
MQHVRRTSVAIVLVGAVTSGGIATAAASSTPRPSHGNVTGGSTTIKLSKSSLNAMRKNGFTLSAISPATFNGKTLKSPIKGGNFRVPTAKVTVGGGFKISHGGKSVTVTKLHSTSSVTGGSGTAVVTGQGRIPATVTSPGTPTLTPTMIKSTGFNVTLAKPLVKVLDDTFGTKLFKAHAQIGTGSATVRYHN